MEVTALTVSVKNDTLKIRLNTLGERLRNLSDGVTILENFQEENNLGNLDELTVGFRKRRWELSMKFILKAKFKS